MKKLTSKENIQKIESMFKNVCSSGIDYMDIPDDENKVYEIYCVYKLLKWLKRRYGVEIHYCGGKEMAIRKNGGKICKAKYAYFKIIDKENMVHLEAHMNIHMRTLGSYFVSKSISEVSSMTLKNYLRIIKVNEIVNSVDCDHSFLHEIDIILIKEESCADSSYPPFYKIIMGIECKNRSTFRKEILREILGTRREMSFFWPSGNVSEIDRLLKRKKSKKPKIVRALPSSMFWLAHISKDISRYRKSPKVFGIKLKNWTLPWNR